MNDLKKYLKFFDEHDEYNEFTGSTEYLKPNVSRCEEEKHVHYEQTERPTAITFVETAITINIDDETEIQLEPIIEPSDVKNKTLLWLTNNPKIATVNADGKVTLNKVGKCTIWAKTIDGKAAAKCFITCYRVMPESIELNKNMLYMSSGETYQLSAVINPSEASQKISWNSSSPSLISVDSSGLVTALALEGESIVTASSTVKPSLTATCFVSLIYVPVTGVSLAKSAVTIGSGETLQLEASVEPEDATIKGLTWQSSDPSMVSVNENGLITANKISGDTVITVTTVESGLTAACNVHIDFVEVTGITLNSYRTFLHSGGTKQLSATVWPLNATIKDVTWSSSDSGVCTVDETGFITAISNGECTITVTSLNGNKTAECNVKVSESLTGEYLTIIANEPSTINFSRGTLSYSLNGGDWTSMSSSGTIATLQANDTLMLKGTAASDGTGGIGSFSASTGNFSIFGNFMSLINGDDFAEVTEFDSSHSTAPFRNLFYKCSGLTDASQAVLPVENLVNSSYYSMFEGCQNLVSAPEINAKNGAKNCFNRTFSGCKSLIYPPYIKTENLTESQYVYTFSGCTSLKEIPELPNVETIPSSTFNGMFASCSSIKVIPSDIFSKSVTIESYGCANMFYRCTGLISGPERLPATTIKGGAYSSMFNGCTSLETAPDIYATVISDQGNMQSMFESCTSLKEAAFMAEAESISSGCCINMYKECTSLTTAKKLPYTTLSDTCYYLMFAGCTSLNSVPDDMLPATTLSQECYMNMFQNCSSLQTAPTLPAPNYNNYCYYNMFRNCSSLNHVRCLLTTFVSGGRNTEDWLTGVSSTGTFEAKASANWDNSKYGYPSGWQRINV